MASSLGPWASCLLRRCSPEAKTEPCCRCLVDLELAAQISAALLSEDQRLKLPRFLEEEEKDPEATRQVGG